MTAASYPALLWIQIPDAGGSRASESFMSSVRLQGAGGGLFSFKFRFPLFEEGRDSFLCIFCPEAICKGKRLRMKPFFPGPKRGIDTTDELADGKGSLSLNLEQDAAAGLRKIFRSHHLVYKACAQGLLRTDHFPGHHQLQGQARTCKPGQSLGAAVSRNDSQVYLRLPEPGRFRGYPEMTRHGQLASSAQRVSVHRSYKRLRAVFYMPKGPLPAFRQGGGLRRRQLPEFRYICARYKSLFTGTCHQRALDLLAAINFLNCGTDLFHHELVEGVHLVGPVDGDGKDAVL